MSPKWLFPVLAFVFAGLAVAHFVRERQLGPAVRAWAILSLIFAAVSAWLLVMT